MCRYRSSGARRPWNSISNRSSAANNLTAAPCDRRCRRERPAPPPARKGRRPMYYHLNRRRLLGWLGLGPAIVVGAPAAVGQTVRAPVRVTFTRVHGETYYEAGTRSTDSRRVEKERVSTCSSRVCLFTNK